MKDSKVWMGCEGCVSTGILLPRLALSQGVGYIQQAPGEG